MGLNSYVAREPRALPIFILPIPPEVCAEKKSVNLISHYAKC